MKNITYIGAGVSTQYGVLHLLKNGYDPSKILIIDKGKDIYQRSPSEVMSGFGGSGTYSDFKIIKSWIQGGIFTPDYVDRDTANRLGDLFIDYVKEYHPDVSKIMYTDTVETPSWIKNSPFDLKQSPCMHLGTDYGREQVRNIYDLFVKAGVKQMYESEVIDIDMDNKTIKIDRKGSIIEIPYEELVIAGGKSGVDFLNKMIDKYNIKTIPRPLQLGVRYETDEKYFDKLLKVAYDFKLYKKWDNVSGRSFCCNSYAAFVAPETTYGYITWNGHAYKNPEKYNGLTNFGIMLEAKNKVEDPFKFQRDLVKLYNKEGKSAYYSPTGRKPSKTDSGESLPCYSITLEEFKKGFGEYYDYIMEFIEDLNKTFDINNDYIIYIPEVKYLSNTLIFNNKDFSLVDYPNIHIQGDNGMSRGIFIAACSGMYVAESFMNNA